MTAAPFLARLDAVVGRGPQWRSRCPSCRGASRKLSLREEADGRTLVHCFAGCSVADIVSAVGLDLSDLFPPKPVSDKNRAPRIRRPWKAGDVLDAMRIELMVAWVVLADLASGKEITDGDRARAGVARQRVAALIFELHHAA